MGEKKKREVERKGDGEKQETTLGGKEGGMGSRDDDQGEVSDPRRTVTSLRSMFPTPTHSLILTPTHDPTSDL